MAGKTKELSWSLTKARMFDDCPRRYYYHYYMAQKYYSSDTPEDIRLASEMKPIQSLDMWAGDVVHQTIQWGFEQSRAGALITDEDVKADIRRRLSDGWQGSVKQLWRTNPEDAYPNLFQHYYDVPVDKTETERIKNKAYLSVSNFIASDLYTEITRTSYDHWLPIEKYASFRVDGLLMYVKFDFALLDSGVLTVYDWKTGKPTPEEIRQLACYSLYASDKWNTPLSNTRACAVHLQPEFEAEPREVKQDSIDEMRFYVKQSFDNMVKSLRNPAQNIAAMEDFPVTINMLKCLKCNFHGICEQGKIAAEDIGDLPIVENWGEQ